MKLLDLDARFAPPLVVADDLWRAGDRPGATAVLDHELGGAQRVCVAAHWPNLTPSKTLVDAIGLLLRQPRSLAVEPPMLARIFWSQLPGTDTLAQLLMGDLRWSEDPFEENPPLASGIEAVSAAVRACRRAAFITDDERELHFRARPVVLSQLAADARKLGGLADAVREPCGAASPADWWAELATSLPAVVLRWFLLGTLRHTPQGLEHTCDALRDAAPHYALAVKRAWASTAGSLDADHWAIVTRAVGRPSTQVASAVARVLLR